MRRRFRRSHVAVGDLGLSVSRLSWLLGLCALSAVTLTLVIVQNLDTDPNGRTDRPISGRTAAATHLRLPRSVNDTVQLSDSSEISRKYVDDGNDASVMSRSGYLELIPSNSTMTSLTDGGLPPRVKLVPYGDAVDLRLLVLAYNRPESLQQCLDSLEAAQYHQNDRISLHVWIDGRSDGGNRSGGSAGGDDEGELRERTLDIARRFNFTHGAYHIHARDAHVGVQGQWMTVWRPPSTNVAAATTGSEEIALIIEDDISVSPFYWRWLKSAHGAYGKRDDVSGFSVSHPEIQHATGSTLEVPFKYTIFMYPVSKVKLWNLCRRLLLRICAANYVIELQPLLSVDQMILLLYRY